MSRDPKTIWVMSCESVFRVKDAKTSAESTVSGKERFSKSERKETQGWLGVRVVSRETASEMEKRKRVVDIWRENQPVLSGDQTGAGGQYFSLFCVDLYA